MPKVGKKSISTERVMPDRERQELVDQIEAEKSFQSSLGRDLPDNGSLGALDTANGLSVDKSKLNDRITKLTKALKEGEGEELTGSARNAAIARHRHLEETLPEILMTVRDQDVFPRDGHDYHMAVRKASKYEIGNPKTQSDIQEYRTLGRKLYPDDPEKSSVERLRRKK